MDACVRTWGRRGFLRASGRSVGNISDAAGEAKRAADTQGAKPSRPLGNRAGMGALVWWSGRVPAHLFLLSLNNPRVQNGGCYYGDGFILSMCATRSKSLSPNVGIAHGATVHGITPARRAAPCRGACGGARGLPCRGTRAPSGPRARTRRCRGAPGGRHGLLRPRALGWLGHGVG